MNTDLTKKLQNLKNIYKFKKYVYRVKKTDIKL